jgi:hypothetical protein
MADKKHGLSQTVRHIIERLFSDEAFKVDALENPELAFAHYSLDQEERQALNSLLGNLSRSNALSNADAKQLALWF